MFCSNCGKQIEDGVRFCKYCGTPTSHPETPAPRPAEELGTKQEERSVQAAPVTAAESSPKSKRKRDFVLPAVLIAAVVIATGGLLVRSMSGNGGDSAAVGSSGDIDNTETIGSDIANNSYAIPELPDALYIAVSTPSPGNDIGYGYIVNGQNLVTLPYWGFQLAKDGTVAVETGNGGGVRIYREGMQIGEIPGSVDYFYLSGSGEKIAYGTSDERTTWLWDTSTGESTLVSDYYRAWEISYDGSVVDIGNYYSRNGQEPKWTGCGNVSGMSPDGKYIYCTSLTYTASNDVKEYHASVSVMINGTSHTIFESEPELDGYSARLIAYSSDYKELLFSWQDNIYYFSVENAADRGFEAQFIGNLNDGELLPLDSAIAYANILSWDSYSDIVSAWRGDWYWGWNPNAYRTQKTIQNGVFCLLKEQNGVKSGSIVRLVDNTLVELIPNITGNICLSDDATKLWCVADGRLVFCDLAAESPHPVYCDTAYVRAYDDSGAVGISGDMIYSEYVDYAMTTVPIVAASDGKTAYFIGVDGSLWMCTPDTVRDPKYITDNAFWVQYSAENTLYLMKGDPWSYFNGTFCDLYQVGSDGKISYLYSNVVDMYMTKTDTYISVGGGSGDTYPSNVECALYCISGGGYKFICDGYRAGDVRGNRWGIRN